MQVKKKIVTCIFLALCNMRNLCNNHTLSINCVTCDNNENNTCNNTVLHVKIRIETLVLFL